MPLKITIICYLFPFLNIASQSWHLLQAHNPYEAYKNIYQSLLLYSLWEMYLNEKGKWRGEANNSILPTQFFPPSELPLVFPRSFFFHLFGAFFSPILLLPHLAEREPLSSDSHCARCPFRVFPEFSLNSFAHLSMKSSNPLKNPSVEVPTAAFTVSEAEIQSSFDISSGCSLRLVLHHRWAV